MKANGRRFNQRHRLSWDRVAADLQNGSFAVSAAPAVSGKSKPRQMP
jgi:hypothetical protein